MKKVNNFGLGWVAEQKIIGVPANNVAYTIFNFTDGYISISKPHCEVNLTIISIEHGTKAMGKDDILNWSNIHEENRTGPRIDPCGTPKHS